MTQKVTILSPFEFTDTTKIGKRAWRKKVLPVGTIDYNGQKLEFSKEYLGGLAQSFKDQAFDQVPLQLATDDNKHNNNPKNFAGEVVAFDLADDGLYATVTTTKEGAAILQKNPKLGISARIINGYNRSDGKSFKSAIQHVLATLDPRVPGLGPWTEVAEFSNANDGYAIIDLSDAVYNTEDNVSELTKDELTALRALLAKAETTDETTDAPADAPKYHEEHQLTDEELEGLLAAVDAEITAESESSVDADAQEEAKRELADAGASLSNDEDDAEVLEFTRKFEQQAVELSRVTAKLDEQTFKTERAMFASEYGIPNAVLDLAAPLLMGEGHVVELSNGDEIDAGSVMRQVITEFGKIVKILDLSSELGSSVEETETKADQAAARAETTKLIRSTLSL